MFLKLPNLYRCLTLLLVLSRVSITQTGTSSARKVDEFGDVEYSDKIARLDNFAMQLQNERSARGFIIVYRTRRDLPGISNRYATAMKNYLVMTRGFSAEHIVTVDGGVAPCLIQELWIVPIGATPKLRSDAYSNEVVDTASARKFDEYYYPLPKEIRDSGYAGYLSGGSLEAFSAALRHEPRSLAYVIVYPQYYIQDSQESYYDDGRRTSSYIRRYMYRDAPGILRTMMHEVKNDLEKTYGIPSSRIKIVSGGYRNFRQVELWIVPRRARPPIATPNAFPPQRKMRRMI